MEIIFSHAEGPVSWSRPVSCASFEEADTLLLRRAMTLPRDARGYWKHPFKIIDGGDVVYSGRHDLYPAGTKTDEHTDTPSLWFHIYGHPAYRGNRDTGDATLARLRELSGND